MHYHIYIDHTAKNLHIFNYNNIVHKYLYIQVSKLYSNQSLMDNLSNDEHMVNMYYY